MSVLIAAKAVINTPEHWTKHVYARQSNDAKSNVDVLLDPTDPRATCFCSTGALLHIKAEDFDGATAVLGDAAKRLFPERMEHTQGIEAIVFFNDHEDTTHDELMQVWDAAIEASK